VGSNRTPSTTNGRASPGPVSRTRRTAAEARGGSLAVRGGNEPDKFGTATGVGPSDSVCRGEHDRQRLAVCPDSARATRATTPFPRGRLRGRGDTAHEPRPPPACTCAGTEARPTARPVPGLRRWRRGRPRCLSGTSGICGTGVSRTNPVSPRRTPFDGRDVDRDTGPARCPAPESPQFSAGWISIGTPGSARVSRGELSPDSTGPNGGRRSRTAAGGVWSTVRRRVEEAPGDVDQAPGILGDDVGRDGVRTVYRGVRFAVAVAVDRDAVPDSDPDDDARAVVPH
jgi:hypothetical protein